jgi:hypothetical protein
MLIHKILSRSFKQKPCPHGSLKAAPLLSLGNEYCLRRLGKKFPKISTKLTPKISHWHDYSELKEVSDKPKFQPEQVISTMKRLTKARSPSSVAIPCSHIPPPDEDHLLNLSI